MLYMSAATSLANSTVERALAYVLYYKGDCLLKTACLVTTTEECAYCMASIQVCQ